MFFRVIYNYAQPIRAPIPAPYKLTYLRHLHNKQTDQRDRTLSMEAASELRPTYATCVSLAIPSWQN